MVFKKVAHSDQLWSGEMLALTIENENVILINCADHIRAYRDCCAHQGVKLSKGKLQDHLLTCSAHEWQYNVLTGCGINPETACLTVFPVKVQDNSIFVDIDNPSSTAVMPREIGPLAYE